MVSHVVAVTLRIRGLMQLQKLSERDLWYQESDTN